MGLIPSWISEIYAFWRVLALPGGKNLNTPFLISLKLCLGSQPLLNLAKYKSEDQEIYFEDLHFSVS